jgi:hypothetical protein
VSARAVAEGEEVEGRKVFDASIIAEVSGRLRFRASRQPVGELFQMLQNGSELTVYLPRDGYLFVGPIDTLNDSAGLLKRLHPLWMLRGLVAYDHLAAYGRLLTWTRLDAATLQAEGPTGFPDLPWGRYVVSEDSLDLLRIYLYDAPRRANEPEPDVGVSVVYGGWTEKNGARLPSEATVALPRENLRLEISNPDYLVNPRLSDRHLTVEPAAGVETYPLWQLVFQDDTAGDDQAGEE